MKQSLLLLWLTVVAVTALGIAGFIFLGTATNSSAWTSQEARKPALISGITCLSIGTGLLVFGVLTFRKRD